jgi:hypothetical protein
VRLAVEGGELVVRQWYGLRTRIPLRSITSVEELSETGLLAGIGAHGWRGHWTVNTRRRPAVRLSVEPPVRGRVLGFPIRLRTLDLAPVVADDLRREIAHAVGG